MLKLIPDIPDALREAAQIGKLVPFVGAGVSQLAGCPGWPAFADRCFKLFLDQGKFSYSQLDQIRPLNPRVKVAIALALQEEHKLDIDFRMILHPAGRVDTKGRRVYSALTRLGTTFVTTNYDEWLDDAMPAPSAPVVMSSTALPVVSTVRNVYFRVSDLTAVHLNEGNTVLHLHGSVKEPSGMILTTPQYMRHYANDRWSGPSSENLVLTFLDDLFRSKTVLFVGYGLEELEILEYVIEKSRGITAGTAPRHFALQGFFSHENELASSIGLHYRQCGITLLPFLKDRKGYDQLIDVLEDFASKLPSSKPMLAQEFVDMEDLLND